MDAIKFLEQQHREVERLFQQFEKAGDGAKKTKEQLCEKIADMLAVHATIEEKIFYPAAKDARTEEQLHEAVEEHLAAKRLIADLVEENYDGDDELKAKMSVLKEQIEHHVEEEEEELFPKVRKLLDSERLEELGDELKEMTVELMSEGDARMQVPGQTDSPAQI